jgi:hypothetical protein
MDFGPNTATALQRIALGIPNLNLVGLGLTGLPPIPDTVRQLFLANNQLTALPALPPNLDHLDCSANQLTTLPALPPTLRTITFGNNRLTVLPALPPGLLELWCDQNELTALPDFPPTLTMIVCNNNPITVLPPLPPGLKELYVMSTNLTALPPLPPGIIKVSCGRTDISTLPPLPASIAIFHCSETEIAVLPVLPPNLTIFTCKKNLNLTKLTPPFPQALLDRRIEEIFEGCPLDPPDEVFETLGQYQARIQTRADADAVPWKGYSASDVQLFNGIFDGWRKNDISFCPVCLAYSERIDGCMYMKHTCKMPFHQSLYEKYKSPDGSIHWCTICGRICLGHRHYVLNLPTDPRADLTPLPLNSNPFGVDCKDQGGGGLEEKHRRIERLLNYACQLQEEVGKMTQLEAITELVEEAWKGGVIRDRSTLKKYAARTFAFPCTFPEGEGPTAEVVYPPVPRPEGEAAPVSHPSPPAECMSELDRTANGQPVFQFIHTQPDGTVRPHPENEWICGQHIEETLKGSLFTGLCFINPEECKARLYPVELEGKVSAEYLANYTKLFNREFRAPGTGGRRRRTYRLQRKYRGGAGPSIMNKIDPSEIQCIIPPKSGGRRRKTRSTRPLGRRGRKSRRKSLRQRK